MNQDPEIALKYGNMLQTEGFQVIESKKKRVHYGKYLILSGCNINFLIYFFFFFFYPLSFSPNSKRRKIK